MATSTMTMAKALNEGLRRAMEKNPKVLLMGEDIGRLGGVFRITDGLQKDFGEDRVIDSPLAESAIVGTAVTASAAHSAAWATAASSAAWKPRTRAMATAMPTAGLTNCCTVSEPICEKYDMVDSPP